MSRRPFDDQALTRVLGGRVPAGLDRAARVRLLAEAARDLLDGKLPTSEARLFLAGGLTSWLALGGDLERDFWKIGAPRGSHLTPAAVLHRDERQTVEDGEDSAATINEERR